MEAPLLLLRQRSREATLLNTTVAAAPPVSACAIELAACAAARTAKDLEGCLKSARAAVQKEPTCGRAWAFLCWALFELRRYDEARRECLVALGYRKWAARDREGMAALRTSCTLLSQLSSTAGDQLRDGWYQKRLRELYEANELHEYEATETRGNTTMYTMYRGAGRDELSLLDYVSPRGLDYVRLGGDGGERHVPPGLLVGGDPSRERPNARDQSCMRGPNFPVEQALGGVVYLKSTILPFHCDKRFGPERTEEADRAFACYNGVGPCVRCQRDGFPLPTHRFPVWAPAPAPGTSIIRPHEGMDVLYSTDSVPARLHQQLRAQLDRFASEGGTQAMPKYHTVIDPNLNAAGGLWVPTEFEAIGKTTAPIELAIAVELACLAATGQRLPFGFGHAIALLATRGTNTTRAECAMRSCIPDLDPHQHHKLHTATQRLMGAALPMLAMMRRPALLLPGPFQAVVKAQRIVLAEGEDYAGVWHEDGMDEHVVAVVLYYYRASPSLRGGALEFCSKQTQALWCGDAGGAHGDLDGAAELASSLPRCQVPIKEGTLVCFSNYAAVHRVLKMEAREAGGSGGGSRDFMAFFVIDQRHPLPMPAALPPLEARIKASKDLLVQQLQPRGTFGFNGGAVFSTGNGSVADVGWVRNAGGTAVEDRYPAAAALMDRLNLQPPLIERGASIMLQGPPPPPDTTLYYDPTSGWAEAWIASSSPRAGTGGGVAAADGGTAPVGVSDGDAETYTSCLYVDLTYGEPVQAEPPEDGVSEVRCFPGGIKEFASFVEDHGFWVEEPVLAARLKGRAIELVVDGKSEWVLRTQLQPIRKLRALAEGSVCELNQGFLDDQDDEEEGEVGDGFSEEAWPHCVAFLRDPSKPLVPLAEARSWTTYRPMYRKREVDRQLFRLKSNAFELGWPALRKAADAAIKEVDAMVWSR